MAGGAGLSMVEVWHKGEAITGNSESAQRAQRKLQFWRKVAAKELEGEFVVTLGSFATMTGGILPISTAGQSPGAKKERG
jgi:hypothetical protein